jgi:hypothetical protein
MLLKSALLTGTNAFLNLTEIYSLIKLKPHIDERATH